MRITRIEIENFRSIQKLVVELGDTTVLIGPNNAGKTAILDALRIALSRRWGQRGTGYGDYDVHLSNENADPKESTGVRIELRAEERCMGEWPDPITADLSDILQLDLATGRRFFTLKTELSWNEDAGAFESSWDFLDVGHEPIGGQGARRINLERLWRYTPVFHLGALRDVRDEFSPRSSQFWSQLLRALEIPDKLESDALQVLKSLNRKLLDADPRLSQISETLSGATKIAARDGGGLDLRMVPLNTWDLISRAEIILRNEPDAPWLPLLRQGQGIQSLSIIFLFRAFVEHLLGELFEPDSEPVLTLEEPETHLHPQAVRTLWQHVSELPGQKIITTHSPYFVQHVPFRELRLVRLTPRGTEVRSLPASYSTSMPPLDGLDEVVTNSNGSLSFQKASETLTVRGALGDTTYRDLLTCCAGSKQRAELEQRLRALRESSALYVSDDELRALETYAQRMRGEIFFAERWLLVEGQADYLIVQAIANSMGYDFDQHGVSVIDAQNNGNPATFAALARALDVPWLAVFDGDSAGQKYRKSIQNRGFGTDELDSRIRTHVAGDLEAQLIADQLGLELKEVLATLGFRDLDGLNNEDLADKLRSNKTSYAAAFASRIRSDSSLNQRTPEAFRATIQQLRESS